jgi:hypothetical protein
LEASNYVKYTEALSWAVSTMTGSSYGDVTPRSFPEVCLSLVIYIVGACILAKVFGDFASLMYLLSIEKTQERYFKFYFDKPIEINWNRLKNSARLITYQKASLSLLESITV